MPQLTMLALLIGGIWIWDAVTPDRPPPPPRPGPKPYQATAPAKLPDVAISDCRKVSSIKGQGGRESAIYTYVENGTRHYASKLPPGCQGTGQGPGAPAPVPATAYFRPNHAPDDTPWPKRAEYLARYSIGNNDGHSNVTVDNTRNDSDVFAKLVSLNGDIARPVRHFFIPAGSRFTMNQVTAGAYDIRYRDLESGALTRSEPFDVEERRTVEGIEYSEMTMTLYKVDGGNFETYDLAEDEF
ncbi:hypothetical protein ACW5DW_07410 [Luteimonas sp. A482]